MELTDQPVTPRSISLSRPATLGGILPDLKIHAGVPVNKPTKAYARLLATALLSRGFHMMLCWRLGAWLRKIKLSPLSILCERVIYHWYQCDIPTTAQIGPALWVAHPMGIVVNSRARIGREVHLRQFAQVLHIWPQDEGRSGLVGDRAQLQSGALLLRGAIVGEDAVIAARAVVSKPVPPRHLAIGMPAKIKPLRPDQFIHESTPDKPEGATGSILDLPPAVNHPPRD